MTEFEPVSTRERREQLTDILSRLQEIAMRIRGSFAASLVVAVAIVAGSLVADAQSTRPATLPDWSGIWAMQGGTVFDRATVQPPNGRAGEPGVREFPPYNDEWEAKYRRNIELVKQGTFPDPISACGDAARLPADHERARRLRVRGHARRGLHPRGERPEHPADLHRRPQASADEELWPTYNGASVGHWEGDTLVFTTISLKGVERTTT